MKNKDVNLVVGPFEAGWSNKNIIKLVRLQALVRRECFIATAVYKNHFAPELVTLRKFRDEILRSTQAGKRLVKAYYKYGPGLADKVREYPAVTKPLRFVLDRFVGWLESDNSDESILRKTLDAVIVIGDKIVSLFINVDALEEDEEWPTYYIQ